MELKDTITLLIAIWGAGLATYLGIRELRNERRRVKIILEYVDWVERAQIVIVNTGHRPITITEIKMGILGSLEKPLVYEGVPFHEFGTEDAPIKLPITLGDGESTILVLSDYVSTAVAANRKIKLSAFDAEGNEYFKFDRRRSDAKWGGYYKLKPIDVLRIKLLHIFRRQD